MADYMQLVGYAKNLPDGSVEVLAQGDDGAVDTLARWLKHGPDMAQVTHVSIMDADFDPRLQGFEVWGS